MSEATFQAADLIRIRRELHQIPEPGFQEFKTQQFLLDVIATLPQDRLTVQTWRTGVLGRVQGTGDDPRKTIGYRADMDGLPITEATSYEFRSRHEGFMHACGHDLHMTIGLGVLAHFAANPVEHDVLVLFQPAEEGPGGAEPMLASAEFSAWRPDVIFALHIAPEYPVGTVATRPGILFANTSELFVDLVGVGGHAAYPHKANDMVVAAAHLVTQLQSIVARNVDPLDSAVVTIGKIESGTKENIIADSARLEGTIRTLSLTSMNKVKARVEALVKGIETSFDCTAKLDYGSNYRQVFNNAQWAERFMDYVSTSGKANLVVCTEAMTGEDFGYFLEQIPGMMFWLGVDTPFGLHHAKLEPNEVALSVAVDVLTGFLTSVSASL
ncbi:MAG: N-acetyldiaminopimelate deacetylase [Alicyclobacillus sp. RIFOXYA1_FULL_53_8]|nr:MAG: N-acetyldiaminopimelate deacetylase [Alicyclobacillus sp. RIFOXYA1_FULL_53_8]